jgi:two-component system sensor histidine kinase KdpD
MNAYRPTAALPRRTGWRASPTPAGLAGATVFVAAATLLCRALADWTPSESLPLVFLVPVLVSAIRYGFWTGLLAAALAFVGYNFFFVEPRHTLSVARPEDALALGIFLLVAAVTGVLAGRMREEADAARHRADVLEILSDFSADLSGAGSGDEIESLLRRHLARAAGGEVVVLKPDGATLEGDRLSVAGGTDLAPPAFGEADLLAADRAMRYGSPQAATAAGWSGSRFSFLPFRRGAKIVAVHGVNFGEGASAERRQAVDAMLRQAELAMDRMAFAREAEDARAAVEQERIRSALLSSISHDLRTPLATILGSVTSLREFGNEMPAESRSDLLQAIEEETGRLSRFVANLLAMTRLEAGLNIRSDSIDAVDVAAAAVRRARTSFPDAAILLDAGTAAAFVHADPILLEQVLFNLIDNAVKFSPTCRPVRVAVSKNGEEVEFAVLDEGGGVAREDLDLIFEKFYRGDGARVAGAGLGLAICRGAVTALGGTIKAESPVIGDHGTRVRVILPAASELDA